MKMNTALELFQALADPTRLRIFALLRAMELSVGELAQVLGQSQPRVSRHLKIMDQAGLIARRKEGNWVFVTLGADRIVKPVLTALDSWQQESDPEMEADLTRLATVRSVRAREAEEWFEQNAAGWDTIRSLYVSEPTVEATIKILLGPEPVGRLVDIGTGTGRMIELLGPAAKSCIGVDRSPAMLRMARSKMSGSQNIQVEWRQGDLSALPLPADSMNTAIMHQVLHYAQHPGAGLSEAARVLKPGGRLLVVDFAAHDRRELREANAHAWLGFSAEQMTLWFREAGFSEPECYRLEGEIAVCLWLGWKIGAIADHSENSSKRQTH
ncbi:metalloregulator ArsR/SmtB family transcription factor [Acetobacter sicerae]|uniref:Metalloregulator ArsR/SmtB family transcription factor n=1 Tax=Acetobacter sicerae TaxID=85325 RepID=A0ABS8VR64_9PROT|nr:metalloregulator ArsR/SmtB family transcription factor [Acetobacter sicerae]MCE0742980.1 metalloregulator ArsR/SmtB family transcription factor [Acetobacter sicerae]